MSPSDKNQSTGNSTSGEGQTQLCSESCEMDFPAESTSPSTSNVTLSGHGTIVNIPWVTASKSTIKCSVNDQMKTFDPGEDGGIERLISTNSGNSMLLGKSTSSLTKNSNKNYKAGSKINKLADMLAKRSQNVVEVKQSNTSDVTVDINSAPKMEEIVIMKSVSNDVKSLNGSYFENSANDKEFRLFEKSRRKSVPNQSCSLQHWQLQSTSKSCSDISELFPSEEEDDKELNALGSSMVKLQTDESTKKKVRKNLRNVKLPLIIPERKKRTSFRNNLSSSKTIGKTVDSSLAQTEIPCKDSYCENAANSIENTNHNDICTKKKESKMKQKKSKKLVESSTQTADIEFISVIKPKDDVVNEVPAVAEVEESEDVETKPERLKIVTYECLYCTQTFTVWSLCKAHEKTHSPRKYKQFRCQYCSKKLFSLEEFKNHCIQKHRNKYAYCKKCDFRFSTKDELYSHNKEIHLKRNGDSQTAVPEESPKSPSQETVQEDAEEKADKKTIKNVPKTDLRIDVSFESTKKSSVSPRSMQKCSPKETKTEEQLLEMEMLFYSHLSGNIQENLTNHLDGKIDQSGIPVRTDQIVEIPDITKPSSLLSVATPSTGAPEVQITRAPSPYQTRSKTPNPLPSTAKKFKKLPNWQQKFWKKYNFPSNYGYEHRFWDKNYLRAEKSAFYLKDLSCLDIKTQLTMRKNLKKLDEVKKVEENSKPADELKFPDYLSLVPRMNDTSNPVNKEELQRSSSEWAKTKKQVVREETKKSFKSPGSELPVHKNRTKTGSDNSSDSKKQSSEGLKMVTRRQSSLELIKDDKEDSSKKRKGSLDLSGNQRMALRRQISSDNIGSSVPKTDKNDQASEEILRNLDLDNSPLSPTGSTEISGEWVRPRSYLCGTCCTKFTNLWELEDHKWVSHPNVWCTHYEFEDEKIDKLFQKNEDEGAGESGESSEMSKSKLTDLYKRYLLPHGYLKTAKLVPKTNFPEECTKCKKNCMSSSEMHKHMLDCGGDTTWFLTMYSSPMTIKRKWRPFGSRRKKQIGRRDVKRNIPTTPTLRSYHYQHRIRTKPGDVETIQKMLANLPEKRARRAINFDEIKTRSQATIHSNRLLRKRFKSTFSNNFLKLKNMKQKRQLKQGKKEGSSKSTTDTSSENTPVGSPKRRNKLKESLQLLKEENSRDGSSENSEEIIKVPKKRVHKKKESPDSVQKKNEVLRIEKPKIKKEIAEVTQEKPTTRSNGFILTVETKNKRKVSGVTEEVADEAEGNGGSPAETKQPKFVSKLVKKSKKNTSKSVETVSKNEAAVSESSDITSRAADLKTREPPVKAAKKMKMRTEVTSDMKACNRSNPHWINSPLLRLKETSKANSELLKSIKKKVKNSRKILEKKEAERVERAEGGSRRSLRIKSLHQSECDSEPISKQVCESSKKVEAVILEKDSKMKTVVVCLDNAIPVKTSNKSPKTGNTKGEKETSEEASPVVRRSLRNSVSSEDKQEVQRNNDSNIISFNPRSLLRRNLRNEKNDSAASDTVEAVPPKPAAVLQKSESVGSVVENKLFTGQVSLLKKNNFHYPKAARGAFKSEEFSEGKKLESSKSRDLEEMPILAKVEPIRGKTFGKTEKEIPVLMPFERDQKRRGSNDDAELPEDTISFQVIKKRRKNSKEITPLKIVKKVDNVSLESGNGVDSSFQIENSESLEECDVGKSKKKKLSDPPTSKVTEKKMKSNSKRYFLGIDPNEIDKGRCDGQDESGSDNEPLICFVNNQVHNGCRRDEVIVKKEEAVAEKAKSQSASLSESSAKVLKSKSDGLREFSIVLSEEKDRSVCYTADNTQTDSHIFRKTLKLKKKIKTAKKKKTPPTAPTKELRLTVTLKEPTLKIIKKPAAFPGEDKWSTRANEQKKVELVHGADPSNIEEMQARESVLPERRSRRISKETKSTNEFVVDDPLILVDELWSDLDSDSDGSRRKSKKGKKKTPKKKTNEEKRLSDVNLEELLRNFGEKKEMKKAEGPLNSTIKIVRKRRTASFSLESLRKAAENRKIEKSYKRLSLKLFRFNRIHKNFGNRGVKLSDAKRALQEKLDEQARSSSALPDLPFLAAEIKENPVQVIRCGVQKPKAVKKNPKKAECKYQSSNIHLKISLPLEAINNMPVFNNNHLTEPILDEAGQGSPVAEKIPESVRTDMEESPLAEAPSEKERQSVEDEVLVYNDETSDMKNKSKRSEVIDKIFYCEICKTYYYSSSQLKIHKLSNRHKLKESELRESQEPPFQPDAEENVKNESSESRSSCSEPVPVVENVLQESPSKVENVEAERLNDDTLEMPTLEGPFIESPFTRLAAEPIQAASPPPVSSFGFSQENLKDIQKAIGCTDEEMLILTLLGENTIEIENDILDLDSCKSNQAKPSECPKERGESGLKESEKANGTLKVDLKQRMTSALACLVNKAVFNLLQKYENAAKTAVNPEALSLLGKLSNLSRRKNVLQLNELLKKRSDGESSVSALPKDIEKKEPTISYKYQCTICGNRFEKASTRECHISRSHRGKAKKLAEDLQAEDEWNDSWSYDVGDDHLGNTTPQFWCSDCGINFLSPQEVLDHQKLEHQAGLKEPDQNKDSGPLQSSTIGSSDEILEGKKIRRRPKLFSSEELNQQRIIANNELRKLDRKFSNKNKSSKIKWGMDALKFTVEKENKAIGDEEDKEIVPEDSLKPPMDVKNIDLVPKLNLSRISNIPEFKVIQKNSFENRFQKIIDNKLKRKCACPSQEENAADDIEEEVMLVPVVVKKKNKKQKLVKCSSKKEETGKPLDVYDFNESESEGEPAVYSHIKKPVPPSMKIKLVKEKEGPSKNKADSTTKDLAPDDYDSEDSLPLSVVKKSKPGDEDDEKDEKVSEDGVEKSDGILEQVEYLIEQLENETGSLKNENVAQASEFERELDLGEKSEKSEFLKEKCENSVNSVFTSNESLRVSVASKFLEMDELLLKNQKCDKSREKKSTQPEEERIEELPEQENESLLAEAESSQSTFDEEDSIPLVLISKKADKSKFSREVKKCDENTTDVSTTASEDVNLLRAEENKSVDAGKSPMNTQTGTEESLPPMSSSSDGSFSEKSNKPFETLNGNVIYCRNDSMTDFDSGLSNDGIIDSNYEKNNSMEDERNFFKDITEKEDVVIVCSKGVEEVSNESKLSRELGGTLAKDTEESELLLLKKKKRFPLLTATIEENNFRRSESPKSNKEVIVRKIWNRKKVEEDCTDNDEDSYISLDNNTSIENLQEDESRTEIEKEIIVKKIWSRKKPELEEEFGDKVEEKFEDIKINQTEVSDEVVIKCGPKAKSSPKRRKSRSSIESSKDTIMRKIWSGRCTFQTKAALKTYESDVVPNCKENEVAGKQSKFKRRRRPSGFSPTKRSKVDSDKDDEDDDLDSLLEEIEREQLEKAIRLEFLQLRRSEKANVEMKESAAPSVGIFTETTLNPRKEMSEKKRRKIKRRIKHPKQSLLKRKKIIRKPFRRVLPSEERNIRENANANRLCLDDPSENSLDKTMELFRGEGKTKNRKHKKHRHKHHHHKHKHKKSKHHKSAVSKHKSKHEFGGEGEREEEEDEEEEEEEEVASNSDSFTILEKICQEIPSQIESESQRRPSSDTNDVDSKAVEVFSVDRKTNESLEVEFENGLPGKRHFESMNIYEFVEDVSDFSSDGLRNLKK